MIAFISAGDFQLFVKPASFSSSEQMKVRSSTRATSLGSDAAWKLFGFLSGLSRVKVPASTSPVVRRSHSSSDPSTQWIASGVVRAATSSTQACRPAWLVPWSCALPAWSWWSFRRSGSTGRPPVGRACGTARDGGTAPAAGSLVSTVGPSTEG